MNLNVKITVSNEGAMAYVQAVDSIVKKHQQTFVEVMDDEDLALIEYAMKELKSGMRPENDTK